MKLHLHVKSEYFHAVQCGEKNQEFRLAGPFWDKRIKDREYDSIVYYNAYKPGAENRMEMPWLGADLKPILHPHFGPETVTVWAIHLRPGREIHVADEVEAGLSDLCQRAPTIGSARK